MNNTAFYKKQPAVFTVNFGYLILYEVNSFRQKFNDIFYNLIWLINSKGNKKEAGLVIVFCALIDNGDVPFTAIEFLIQFVGHQSSCCSGSEYNDGFHS
jgi:hypothetical protein